MNTEISSDTRVNPAREVQKALDIAIEAIQGLAEKSDEKIEQALELLLGCTGKIVVTGMGKSGHIGKKIAATLSSTGSPAIFLHPAEAIHGDLGVVTSSDIVVALSNSGSTAEILHLMGPLRRIGVPIVSMTGNPESELALRSDINLDVSVKREACPLNLAPTASTTAALAMGDAIAVTLLKLRNFKAEDYALFHPGGSLGKKLVTTVSDLMEPPELSPIVNQHEAVERVVHEIQSKGFGITMIVDDEGQLVGAFSLGDLLRLHTTDKSLSFMKKPVSDFMKKNPYSIAPDMLAARALHEMESNNVRALFAIDSEKKPAGIIGIYEILKAIDY